MNAYHVRATPQDVPVDLNGDAFKRGIAAIATNTWRAMARLAHTEGAEDSKDTQRVRRHVEAIYRNLADIGVIVRDHTGDVYDEGQPMKVIASKPTLGLLRKEVSETLLPSVFWKDRLIQNGEVEIAIPMPADNPTVFG